MTTRYSIFSISQGRLACWLLAIGMLFALAACGGGGASSGASAPAGAATSAIVSGVIQDATGQPAANAQVHLAGKTSTTAADGRFSFTVDPASASLVLLVKKSGFATNAKDVPVRAGSTTEMTVKIFSDQVSTTFSASTGTTLALAQGASVAIPANSLQTANGVAYAGTVTAGASYFGPDTLDGVRAFPAPYVGTDAGAQSPLITAGVIEVKLGDAAGNPLQLKAGMPATLTYPANSVSGGASSIPLWYYEESSRLWVRDGAAAQQVNGSYQASVTHFTLWNVDFKGATATIKGCFQGGPASAAGLMGLRGNGWQSYGLGSQTTTDGSFTVIRVPAGIPLELYSLTQPAAFASLAIPSLAPGEVRQLACVALTNPPLGSTLVLTPPSSLFITSPGSFAGAYSGTYSGTETGTFAIVVGPTGQITGSVTSTTFPGVVVSASGTVGPSGAVSLMATGQAGIASFQGSATAGGGVNGTWVYTSGRVGNGDFSGQRN